MKPRRLLVRSMILVAVAALASACTGPFDNRSEALDDAEDKTTAMLREALGQDFEVVATRSIFRCDPLSNLAGVLIVELPTLADVENLEAHWDGLVPDRTESRVARVGDYLYAIAQSASEGYYYVRTQTDCYPR